jgi:hypothetical protein
MLATLARHPNWMSDWARPLLFILDEEIQATAVACSSEQRAVLDRGAAVPAMGPSPRPLSVVPLPMPAPTGSAAMVALINESRLLVAHPCDNTC